MDIEVDDDIIAAACINIIAATALLGTFLAVKKRKHSCWVSKYLKTRNEVGAYNCLIPDLLSSDPAKYKNYLRMDFATFEELFNMVKGDITTKDTRFRKALPAREKLAATLRILATGETYKSIAYQFRHGRKTVGNYFPKTCKAIFNALKNKYMKVPNTNEEWLRISTDFYNRWNYPNAIGCVDGKLVHVRRPFRGGSRFFNYKRTYSVNLMAIVDAHLRFLYVSIGAQGSCNDASVFNATTFAKKLANKRNPLNIPPDAELPGTAIKVPFMLVGDEAYPMKRYLLKPFSHRGLTASERIFNYRLSRCRRCVENAFGILSSRFRIYYTTMQLQPKTVEYVVFATCALHNYLLTKDIEQVDCDSDSLSSLTGINDYRNDVKHTSRKEGMNYNAVVKQIRDTLASYFVGVGQVPWQWRHGNVV